MLDYDLARKEISKADPVMAAIIKEVNLDPLVLKPDYFIALVRAIMGQQVSVAAAASIFKRLEASIQPLTAETLQQLSQDDARALGISRQKHRYLHDLSTKVAAGLLDDISALEDSDVQARLMGVLGIGRWTAEMFMMFTLGRPDIFAPDDLGLRRSIERHYPRIPKDSPLKVYEELASNWSPHRTVACLYLWRSYDTSNVEVI